MLNPSSNRYSQAQPEGICLLEYCPGFPSSVVCSKVHCKIRNWEEELAWNVERSSTKLSQALSHFFPCYFREVCQVLDGIEISSAVWTHVHLWFCPFTTEHLTGVSGHYPCSISKNRTSNITVLTSAESKGDFPLCWLCCYMAKAILQSCLAGILLWGCSPSSEAMLKGIIIKFR